MPRPSRLLLPLLAIIGLMAACSQEKDSFVNRAYHRLTARDNGWFNANEKLKEVVMDIEDANKDDFDEVLPLFIYGSEQQAQQATPDLEKCIDKCSLVIERHSMEIQGKEKNSWVDDAWFVIAKSQFYKRNFSEAQRGFTYISRHFKGSNRELEAEIWLARTAIRLEQFAKAQSALDHVNDAKKKPKSLDAAELEAVQAELELKRGKVDDAILHLERAVPMASRKRERVRWAFILAQLYGLKGQEEKAIQQFAEVVKMGPPYEIAFHAQVFQALGTSKGDLKAQRKKLMAMLRDQKHKDHFDLIRYALADIDLKERKKKDAVAQLRRSIAESTTDTKQKAKSYLKLADLHFDDRLYVPAQQYYDSTKALLPEQHARYAEVETRARVLGDLVEQLNIIAREDSLQALGGLDEEALGKKVRDIIRDREKAEEDRARQAAEARDKAPDAAVKPAGGNRGGGWYFYDPQQLARGLSNFRKRWGTRPLEDNWRRKDKSGSALAMPEEEEADQKGGKEEGEPEWKDPAFYTKDIPREPEALAASNARICSALYTSGMIYKEQLRDVDNAIESFEVLNNRFEECRYTPESHYQLYRIYLQKERDGWFSLEGIGSETYKNIILERWPDSEFARLVRDPNVLMADAERRKAEEEAYREVYRLYRERSYDAAIAACDRVIEGEPSNYFRPKYHFLKAMCIGGKRQVPEYRAALQRVVQLFAGTEEAQRAQELLGEEGVQAPAGKAPAPAAAFKKGDGQHYYAVVVPNEGSDITSIRMVLSDFNSNYFRSVALEVTASFLDPQHQLVLVQPLADKGKAMEYHALFTGNKDVLRGINDQGYPAFAITPENYQLLFKSKDVAGYQVFFQQNYLDRQ